MKVFIVLVYIHTSL